MKWVRKDLMGNIVSVKIRRFTVLPDIKTSNNTTLPLPVKLTTSSSCNSLSADFITRCVFFLYSSSQLLQDITTSNRHSLGCNGLSKITPKNTNVEL